MFKKILGTGIILVNITINDSVFGHATEMEMLYDTLIWIIKANELHM